MGGTVVSLAGAAAEALAVPPVSAALVSKGIDGSFVIIVTGAALADAAAGAVATRGARARAASSNV
jgi:hypothetical protein